MSRKPRNSTIPGLCVALAALAAGCATSTPQRPAEGAQPAPPQSTAAATATPAEGAGAQPAAPPSTTASAPAPHPSMRVPIVVEASGPDRVAAGQEIEVVVRIRRNAPNALPIQLAVAIPAGVVPLAGALNDKIVDDTSPLLERRLKLRVDRVPSQDLVVTLDQKAADYGAHATAAYRFGRPEPKLPTMRRSADSPKVEGRSLGTPIPLQ